MSLCLLLGPAVVAPALILSDTAERRVSLPAALAQAPVLAQSPALAQAPVLAQSQDVTAEEAEVEKLTNEILCKEVDLERYYLKYRNLSTASPRFRRIRYFLLQVASTSCTLASNIIFTDVARKGLNGNVTDFGRGASLALAGAVTSGGGKIAGLVYTNYNLISEYSYRKKMRQQKLLPDQLLLERFKVLNQSDKMLDGTSGKDGK